MVYTHYIAKLVSLDDYSAFTTTTNSETDWAPALQQAIDDAAAAGGGVVRVSSGEYKLGALVFIDSFITLEGVGLASQFTQIDGTAGGLATRDFATLTGGGTNGGPYRFEIRDLYLLGAKGAGGTGNGLSIYGTHFFLERVAIRGFAGYGLWTEYRSANAYGPLGHPDGWPLESRIQTVTLMDNDAGNLEFRGPHDGIISDLVAVSQNITGDAHAVNVNFAPEGSGVQISNIHCWGADCDYVFQSSVPIRGDNLVVEGGKVAQLHLVNVTGANLQNVHAFGQNNAGQKGVLLDSCERVALGVRVNGCPDGVVEFVGTSGGANDVDAVFSQTSANPVLVGTPDATDRYQLTGDQQSSAMLNTANQLLGFFGGAPVPQQTASDVGALWSALAAYGLLDDGAVAPAPYAATASGTGAQTAFPVNHGLNTNTPDKPTVIVDGVIVVDGWSATIVDADNLTVNFDTAPAAGTDNITIKVVA